MDRPSSRITDVSTKFTLRWWVIVAASCCVGSEVFADPFPATPPGLPPQIMPSAPEVGVTILQVPNGGNVTSDATSGVGATGGGETSSGSSSAYATLMATNYGNVAASDAQQAGVSIDALAAIGQAESGFQNIPTANGSSSATGPWQITAGTFADINAKYALGYSASDITNPAAQAAVASYIIKDYASTVSQATQQPATVVQTYGAYVFGPSAGANIATAAPSTPLNQFVSATALSNNNMQGWTVGQFNATMGGRLGSTANSVALSSS
jgi:Transglycosylase SLT domain